MPIILLSGHPQWYLPQIASSKVHCVDWKQANNFRPNLALYEENMRKFLSGKFLTKFLKSNIYTLSTRSCKKLHHQCDQMWRNFATMITL